MQQDTSIPQFDVDDWLLDPPDASPHDIARTVSDALDAVGARAGIHSQSRLTAWLNAACRRLVTDAFAFARTLDADELLRGLMLAHEALRISDAALRLAARGDVVEAPLTLAAREQLPSAAPRAISLRLAVEMHSALPPTGSWTPSTAELRRLWSLAFAILKLGTTSDFVHIGLVEARLDKRDGLLALPDDAHLAASMDRHASALAVELTDPFRQAMGFADHAPSLTADETREEARLQSDLNAALVGHVGVSLDDLAHLVGFLGGMAGFQPFDDRGPVSPGGLNTALESDLAPVVAGILDIDEARARRALRFLSIGPTESFPSTDHKPWVFGRARSYIARPLVRHRDGARLSWSGMHTYFALDLLASQLTYAALPDVEPGSDLHAAMHAYSTWRGRAFEAEVEGVVRADLRLRARRVVKLDGERLSKPDGNPLGDIDVLAADPGSHTLLVLEAKASAPSRTPSEHVRELLRFRATEYDRTDLDRHLMRMQSVRARPAAALQALGLETSDASSWRIRGAVITQVSSIAAHIPGCQMPVVSMPDLRRLDLVEWIRALP